MKHVQICLQATLLASLIAVRVDGAGYTDVTITEQPSPQVRYASGRVVYVEAIDAAIHETEHDGRPLVVLCYTNSAQGIPLLDERKPKLHYVRFGGKEELDRYQAVHDAWQFEETA